MKTFVIAEAGSTHGGSLEQMDRLVDLAAAIGADACKFQWTSSPERLAERRRAPEYLDAYGSIAFTRAWLPLLAVRCQQRGIEFMCTVYLPEDIHVVAPYVKRFKVASFEARDESFVRDHEHKPRVISTGMMSRADVWPYFRLILRPGDALLHCVSAYPAPNDQMGLRTIRALWIFDKAIKVGLSDHSRHPWTGAVAVAAGAEIVEFHVRLDDTDSANADYAVSRSPAEAREYVEHVRLAEVMLGDGIKRVMESEAPMLHYRVRP